MSRDNALQLAISRYLFGAPTAHVLQIASETMMEHFKDHADEEEIQAFLLEFGEAAGDHPEAH